MVIKCTRRYIGIETTISYIDNYNNLWTYVSNEKIFRHACTRIFIKSNNTISYGMLWKCNDITQVMTKKTNWFSSMCKKLVALW